MNTLNSPLRAVTGVAVAAILAQALAGCSGASSSLPAAPASFSSAHLYVPAAANAKGSAALRVQPDKSAQLLFVSDNLQSKVYVFDALSKTSNPAPLYTITDGISNPNGIATDTAGNLWVANLSSNEVIEYAKGSSTPEFTISNGMNGPYDVKVDGFGNVFVAMDGEYGGSDTVVEYAAGTAVPIYTWSVPQSNMQITGIALTNPTLKGETGVYALEYQNVGSGAEGGLLACFPGGSNTVCTHLTNYLYGQTGGITIASQGARKPFEFLAADTYLPGIDETIPNPPSVKRLIMTGVPQGLTLNAKGSRLFVADETYGSVNEYTFPANKPTVTFSGSGKSQLIGVATSPSGNYN
jgi:sugar lactone lactonase YvrE